MHNLIITILIVLFLCKSSAALGGGGALVGGWKPIPDVTDPTVVSIGKFAVDQHNKEAHTSLKFRKVIKGESQVVQGMKYNLTITAADAGNYVAVVWDKPWEKFRQLLSFNGPV